MTQKNSKKISCHFAFYYGHYDYLSMLLNVYDRIFVLFEGKVMQVVFDFSIFCT